jgi:hypothetical protein
MTRCLSSTVPVYEYSPFYFTHNFLINTKYSYGYDTFRSVGKKNCYICIHVRELWFTISRRGTPKQDRILGTGTFMGYMNQNPPPQISSLQQWFHLSGLNVNIRRRGHQSKTTTCRYVALSLMLCPTSTSRIIWPILAYFIKIV